jgi:hypothetical protein
MQTRETTRVCAWCLVEAASDTMERINAGPSVACKDMAACKRRMELGTCTRDHAHGPAEVPWAGERLCWNCADQDLDLLAKAVLEDPDQLVTVKAP